MLNHRTRDHLYKRGVGLLFVVSVVLVMYVIRTYQNAERFLGSSFRLHAQVERVDGLEVDATVTMAGLKVGKVRDIDLLANKTARVELEVELRYRDLVRTDSRATLAKPLIGPTVVDISIGTPELPALADGGAIVLVVRPDLGSVVAELPARLEKVDRALDDLVAITGAARSSTLRLAAPNGPLDATLADVRASASHIRAASETLKTTLQEVQKVTTSGQSAIGQAQAALTDVRALTTQAGAMGASLQRTLGNAEEFTAGLRTLGPQAAPAVNAVQGAAEEAEKVLRAASTSVLLGGPSAAPSTPVLITPRAP